MWVLRIHLELISGNGALVARYSIFVRLEHPDASWFLQFIVFHKNIVINCTVIFVCVRISIFHHLIIWIAFVSIVAVVFPGIPIHRLWFHLRNIATCHLSIWFDKRRLLQLWRWPVLYLVMCRCSLLLSRVNILGIPCRLQEVVDYGPLLLYWALLLLWVSLALRRRQPGGPVNLALALVSLVRVLLHLQTAIRVEVSIGVIGTIHGSGHWLNRLVLRLSLARVFPLLFDQAEILHRSILLILLGFLPSLSWLENQRLVKRLVPSAKLIYRYEIHGTGTETPVDRIELLLLLLIIGWCLANLLLLCRRRGLLMLVHRWLGGGVASMDLIDFVLQLLEDVRGGMARLAERLDRCELIRLDPL